MKTSQFITIAVFLLSGGSARAFDYFSVGATTGVTPGDPGIAPYELMAVTFDQPSAWFVTEQDTGAAPGSLIYQGATPNVAAAPTGDTTKYEAVSPGQTATFSFGPVTPLIHTISFYFGSIDAYNQIHLLNPFGQIIGAIQGGQWPGDDGDQFAAATNRRVYITNLPANFYAIQFLSTGIAEEYDDIAVSNAVPCFTNFPPCVTNGGTPSGLPVNPAPRPIPIPPHPPGSLSAPIGVVGVSVPEPATWVLMAFACGILGAQLRARRSPVYGEEPSAPFQP